MAAARLAAPLRLLPKILFSASDSAVIGPCLTVIHVRGIKKHWNPKFKKLRRLKFIKVDLPDFYEKHDDNMTPEEIRLKMKEKGLKPARHWMERPVCISATTNVFEPYVPPEGDGKASKLTLAGTKQSVELLTKKGRARIELGKIRDYDEDFHPADFAQEAQDIYIKAHSALNVKDRDILSSLITEKIYLDMIDIGEGRTIHWNFIKSLEPPRVVHLRTTHMVSKENVFAQVTVRLHTQQSLAVYDRFGRLIHGSEVLAKDVLEYIVFEKHLAHIYGSWRIHDKIVPSWMPPKDEIKRTYYKPEQPPPPPPTTPTTTEKTQADEKQKKVEAIA